MEAGAGPSRKQRKWGRQGGRAQSWDTLHTCFQLGNPCVPQVWAGAGAWEYGHSGLVLYSWGPVAGFGMWVRQGVKGWTTC